MEDNSVLLTISGIAVVSAFAIVSLFYIRAVSAISQIVRKKNPAAWQLGLDDAFKRGDGDPRHPLLDWWILGIVLDIRKLDLHARITAAICDTRAYHLLPSCSFSFC